MSLLNVFVQPAKVILSVDTQSSVATAGGPTQKQHTSKLLTLPHANIVMASRGDQLLFNGVFAAAQSAAPELTIDALGENLAAAGDAWWEILTSRNPEHAHCATEIVAAGWCGTAGRMVAFHSVRYDQEGRFKTTPLTSYMAAPGFDWKHPPVIPDGPGMCEVLARKQVARHRQELPDAAIGGLLLYAEVTRDSTSIRTIADLG